MSAARSEDRTLLRHLGQPFYFRHTPPLALRRGAFWLGFLVVVLIVLINLLLMPYPRESTPRYLRDLLGWGRGYETYEAGAKGIATQFLLIATVLSGIVAPLYATYSLAMERVGGTIEFLKLSPMSTLSVVLGKMFAPAYLLHLFSGGLLLLATAIGFVGGYGLGDLSLTLLSIACATATVHAAGAFLACATTAFRGFGPVVGLIGVGLLVYCLPFAAYYEAAVSFMRYLSPFSTMDAVLWKDSAAGRWYGRVIDEFFGLRGAIAPSVLLIHGTLSAVLVWAAARWLDHPEGTALPRKGYLILMGLVLLVALGTVPNSDQRINQGYYPQTTNPAFTGTAEHTGFWSPSFSWENAMAIVLLGGLAVCLFLILDHPHRRELVQEEFSERAGGRETGPVRRLGHAFFAGTLTVGVLAAGLACQMFTPYSAPPEFWAWVLTLGFGLCAVIFLSLVLETAWVRYRSPAGRAMAAAVMVALLTGSLLYPLIDWAQKDSAFWSAYYHKSQMWQLEAEVAAVQKELAALQGIADDTLLKTVTLPSAGAGANTAGQSYTLQYYFNQYNDPATANATVGQYRMDMEGLQASFQQQQNYYSVYSFGWKRGNVDRYLADMSTPEAHADLGAAMRSAPFAVLLKYHASVLFWYPLLPLVACGFVIWFRRRTYRALEKEALEALAKVPPAPKPASNAAAAEPSSGALPAAGA